MKYIKKLELIGYKKDDFYDVDEYDGPLYLYSNIPLDKNNINHGRIYLYNRADASDTSSEYIYQIKLKNPLYKKNGNGFLRFANLFDDINLDDKVSLKSEKKKYSGYFYHDILSEWQVKITKPEDILSFKYIGGFVKYDKNKIDKQHIQISEKTDDWLYSYISGSMRVPKLSQYIIDELKQFKNIEPIKIFKGIEEVQIKYYSEDKPPYKKGQKIISNFTHPSSWTTNVLIARRFIDDYPSSTPYVISMIANPEDVLVNVQMLQQQYYHTNQREIIMLPGKYTYKIVWEN